ncbi:HD domain-containing phosphohydrolase [Deinococcus sonorensis]|uniref:HD domain-containing phosphohydrolase n=2 Tax=Deinococcus sonorensis TaxID=309891 RepID=A0AAU7U4M4_9DEIO
MRASVSPLDKVVQPHPYDAVQDVLYILDAERRFTFVNAFALAAWHCTPDALLGQRFEDGLPVRPGQDLIDAVQQAIDRQERAEFETFGGRHQRWINLTLYPHHGGVLVQVRPLLRDVRTAARDANDALTGCLTRQTFLDVLATPHPCTQGAVLALVDLNRLKLMNAVRGHTGGDLHIRQVAHLLQEALPAGGLICRWGGDEFVLLAPGQNPGLLTRALDHALRHAPAPQPGVPAYSSGLAVWPGGTPFERAFAIADDRLQQQKDRLYAVLPDDGEVLNFVAFSQQLEMLDDPDDITQYTLERLLTLLDFDHAVFQVWDAGGATYTATHQAIRAGLPVPLPALGAPQPLAGAFRTVQRTQRTAWSTDYPSSPEVIPLMVEQGVKSGIMTPVFSQGRIVASITLRTVHRWHTITPHMRKVLELAALRLEHALELRRVAQQVRETLEAGLLTLGIALEARDLETHGHTQRTTEMAGRLGEALGLRGSDLDQLREGAYLHDLGKLCVPDAILHKPGRLTADEWTVMQTHTTRGWDLACRIPNLATAVLEVIRHHHERWDGGGYPDGLAGEAIPLVARIFAVCDVYDALISERPYKPAWSADAAVREIQAQSGRQFDPAVVRAFLSLHGEAALAAAVPRVS